MTDQERMARYNEAKERVRYVTLQDGSVVARPDNMMSLSGTVMFNWPCAKCARFQGWHFLEPVGPRLCAACRWETR